MGAQLCEDAKKKNHWIEHFKRVNFGGGVAFGHKVLSAYLACCGLGFAPYHPFTKK
jgi:hypothetical protein